MFLICLSRSNVVIDFYKAILIYENTHDNTANVLLTLLAEAFLTRASPADEYLCQYSILAKQRLL